MKNSILNGELNPFSTNDVGSNKMQGVVKWFNKRKGFGFITPNNGGPAVFVHRSGIVGRDSLGGREWVEFDVVQETKGPKAINVRVPEQKRQ